MAKNRNRPRSAMDTAAEAAGRTLAQVTEAVSGLQKRHPHPIAEAQEAWAEGMEKLNELAAGAEARRTEVVADVKRAVKRVRKVATRAGRQTGKALAKAQRTAKKVVTRAQKAAAGPRKELAKRLKPVTAPAKSARRKATATPVRKKAKPASRPLQSANVKRRQAHTAAVTRRRQARRDKKG